MSTPSERLAELGIELPPVPPPAAIYVPAVRTGNLVYSSGQIPSVDGAPAYTGKVGAGVSLEDAQRAARICALNAVAAVAAEAGGVDEIEQIVKVLVFVASDPGFTAQAQVGNGASEVLGDIFGAAGAHARSAVGMAVLPLDVPVEVELIARVRTRPSVQPV
ncbi:enamine deaminase RidA (YjgF/YER057c/UK114 family) [Friedmanniella endophytica]|uniref:Enamine deaminase RidA (YjgF/YER057c/UK114 family) n=1 Tax=Microlunatus kandeliicorticis TaxID=1759536 RepID=A0A7W3P5L2_9ACTN|nr:RidA family protein [Microlunatus kandeliicorticis]MBA8793980.1 enamine deaminase RidA (YjgF/YER057c/UK114 family) [Microlunatus kandeliicorticis]